MRRSWLAAGAPVLLPRGGNGCSGLTELTKLGAIAAGHFFPRAGIQT